MQTVEIMADGSENICNFEGNSENPVDILWNPKQVGEYFYEYLGNFWFHVLGMFGKCPKCNDREYYQSDILRTLPSQQLIHKYFPNIPGSVHRQWFLLFFKSTASLISIF